VRIDDVDRRILDHLKTNGREPAASIAKRINLSPAATQRRIDRLEKSGVIKGYTVAVDYGRIEASIDGYIEFSFAHGIDIASALDVLIKLPHVREVVALAGDPDVLLRVRVKTPDELGVLAMGLRQRGSLHATKTHVVIGRRWHGAVRTTKRSRSAAAH
jgi:DNA-binding Lrp family transcriptional regulator